MLPERTGRRSLRGSATTSSRKTEKFRVNLFAKVLLCTTSLLSAIVVLPPAIFASGVDPTTVYARAWAVLAAEPYVKQGFHMREDYWVGDLVHIYNSDGKLAEQPDSWAKGQIAAAHIIPKATSTYFIIVSVEESPAAHTHWALAYGFR